LQRNGAELLGAMKPARRMDVKDGNREDQTSSKSSEPASDLAPSPGRSFADHVIATVDGFKERLQMSR
jgi:hypothetical protein